MTHVSLRSIAPLLSKATLRSRMVSSDMESGSQHRGSPVRRNAKSGFDDLGHHALRAAVHEQKYRSSLALPHAGFQARLLRDGADEGGADHGNLDPMRSTRVRRWW